MYMDNIKPTIKRIVKTYRIVKPELKLITCFTRYAGIVSIEGRAIKDQDLVKKKDAENVTLKDLLKQMVHVIKLFILDFTPQAVLNVFKTILELFYMTREMYTVMKRDEMGGCSLDYIHNRFWWWLGSI